jgi:flagellar basal body rod protein FlgB
MALLNSLNNGVAALKVFSKSLEVIGDNIANVNTTAFKASHANYEDSFSDVLQRSAPSDGTTANRDGIQAGTGVNLASIRAKFTQGSIQATGNASDLADGAAEALLHRTHSTLERPPYARVPLALHILVSDLLHDRAVGRQARLHRRGRGQLARGQKAHVRHHGHALGKKPRRRHGVRGGGGQGRLALHHTYAAPAHAVGDAKHRAAHGEYAEARRAPARLYPAVGVADDGACSSGACVRGCAIL